MVLLVPILFVVCFDMFFLLTSIIMHCALSFCYIYACYTHSVLLVELKGVQGFEKDNYYYLCDGMTGMYISSGYSSSSSAAAAASATQTFSPEQYPAGNEYIDERIKQELRKKIQCLLNITDPFLRPNYGIDCSVPLFQNPQPKPIQIEDISDSGRDDDNDTNNESENEPGTTESEDPVTIAIGDLDAINIGDWNGCATVGE